MGLNVGAMVKNGFTSSLASSLLKSGIANDWLARPEILPKIACDDNKL